MFHVELKSALAQSIMHFLLNCLEGGHYNPHEIAPIMACCYKRDGAIDYLTSERGYNGKDSFFNSFERSVLFIRESLFGYT